MPPPYKPISVAFIDDDLWQLEATKIFFEPEDSMQIRLYSSPNEALDGIIKGEFDCVVTDYRMQGINGVDLVKTIRSKSEVPVVIFSMYDEPEIEGASITAGANSFILKNSTRESYKMLAEEIKRLTRGK